MSSAVSDKVVGQGKGLAAVVPGADKRLFLAVKPAVLQQAAPARKGFGTAVKGAGEGALPCMRLLMPLQGRLLGKGAAAALEGAGKGFFSGMNPCVSCQVAFPAECFSAVRRCAVQRVGTMVVTQVLAQAVGGGQLF